MEFNSSYQTNVLNDNDHNIPNQLLDAKSKDQVI